jgi:hypothetical protein
MENCLTFALKLNKKIQREKILLEKCAKTSPENLLFSMLLTNQQAGKFSRVINYITLG